ncbi:unnamed protein product [Oppiella nova]|uniref:Amidase domain-containing protein n=1 Tax=Oppiella nova TaxID=334625 RepID=A0A7R9LEF1_9ACAR|nr:unnamed protein product [Oppiella nova]CAG2162722.1 unnamed protein product [Oppiella nova]
MNIKRIEETTVPNPASTKLALIRGQRSVISRDFAAYRSALERHKFSIDAPNWLRSKRRASTQTAQNMTDLKDWLILFCLAFTDGDDGFCLQRKDIQTLKPYQKVNRIPGLRNLLWKRDTFCQTMTEARKVHPLGYSAEWLLKPISIGGHSSGNGPQLINIFTNEGRDRLREYNVKRGVIQQYIANPLLVFGQPVSLRLYVIVTSMAPLRAYVHSEGLVFHRYEENRNYKKIPGRTWILSQFWQFISKNNGTDSMKKAINSIYRAILQTLLIAEAMLITQQQQHSTMHSNNINSERLLFAKCNSCFHLMAFDIILNSSLEPFIIEVNGQPNMQESRKDESPLSGGVKKLILDDVIDLISATDLVANDVSEALDEVIDENIGVMGISCHISHDLCLSRDDLSYLLSSRREALNKGSFKNLYPALGIEAYKPLIDELSQLIVAQSVGQTPNELSVHKTADLHPLLMSLERYYYRHIIDEEYGDSAGNTANEHSTRNQISFHNSSVYLSDKNPFDSTVNGCSDEPSSLPYLASIELSPKLQLMPPFSPLITQYHCNVSYEQLMVSVWAKAQNCQSEVRLEDKFGSSRTTNYTLGIGVNKISLVVVDISHTEPWVINTYTLIINRVPVTHNVPEFRAQLPHRVCSFTQDCDMRVFPRNQCGLSEQNDYSDWRAFLYRQSLTTKCRTGAESGHWMVPCQSCHNSSTCYWREARWDPLQCHYPILSQKRLSSCLTNKKILFVGDSTNRGIMHYLIERLNGTLVDWDKTHDLKIYPNMNRKKTLISFAYYPKFWLPTNQRPSFDRAVYQLFEKVQPLENNSNTVLIFGGVQWLATQHIHMLLKTLAKKSSRGIGRYCNLSKGYVTSIRIFISYECYIVNEFEFFTTFCINKCISLFTFICLRIIRLYFDAFTGITALVFTSSQKGRVPPIGDRLLLQSAHHLSAQIKTGKLKSEVLVKAFVDRIKVVQPYVNAVVDQRYVDAVLEAIDIDKRVQHELYGNDPLIPGLSIHDQPLLGIPFSCKDSVSIEGLAIDGAVEARKGMKAGSDAKAIEYLRRAGAIPLVLTNIPEMTMWWSSANSIYGQTNNPYDLSRIPGGSSGGEGALISSAASVVGVGSDFGGSIRIPSFFCGIFGHKPSPGLVPIDGQFPEMTPEISHMQSIGPMTRYSSDLLPMLKAMVGSNGRKLKHDESVDLSKLKIYYMEENGNPFDTNVSPDIKSAIRRIVSHMSQKYGNYTKKVHFDAFRDAFFIWIYTFKQTKHILGEKKTTTSRWQAVIDLFKYFANMSDHTLYYLILSAIIELTPSVDTEFGQKYVRLGRELKQEFKQLLGNDGVFIYPTHPEAAPKHLSTILKLSNISYTMIFNALGVPVTTCPMGLNRDGLPIGVQIVGSPLNDHLTIAVAQELEKAFGGWVSPSKIVC